LAFQQAEIRFKRYGTKCARPISPIDGIVLLLSTVGRILGRDFLLTVPLSRAAGLAPGFATGGRDAVFAECAGAIQTLELGLKLEVLVQMKLR
jgi:hypothetical protein